MPVRIIFRGLTLFRIENEGTSQGKIIAQLIDKPTHHNPHAHHDHHVGAAIHGCDGHDAEIQILTGEGTLADAVPRPLSNGLELEVSVPTSETGVERSTSFIDHVPSLAAIADRSTGPNFIPVTGLSRNESLIKNVVTVDRGVVRGKNIVNWDFGGFPLNGTRGSGDLVNAFSEVKFMCSDVRGHLATECVIEIPDANELALESSDPALSGSRRASGRHNRFVPPNTVDIVITNLGHQRTKPIPWGLHFMWFFEAAGYQATDLAGDELDAFKAFASRYDAREFAADEPLLAGGRASVGLPFPYVVIGSPTPSFTPLATSDGAVVVSSNGSPLTDEHDRPLCIHAQE